MQKLYKSTQTKECCACNAETTQKLTISNVSYDLCHLCLRFLKTAKETILEHKYLEMDMAEYKEIIKPFI